MFGNDDDDDTGSGVATMEREERKEEYIAQWPNKQYIAETLEQFPDAGIASVEQARVCSWHQSGRLPSVMGCMHATVTALDITLVGGIAALMFACTHQVLFSEGGYTYLDVRPALEFEDIGKVVVRPLSLTALR